MADDGIVPQGADQGAGQRDESGHGRGRVARQADEEPTVGQAGQQHLRAGGDADAVDQPACVEVAQDAAQVVVRARGGRPGRDEDVDVGVVDLAQQQLLGVGGAHGRVAARAERPDEGRHRGAEGVTDPAVARQAPVEQVRAEDEDADDGRAHDLEVVVPAGGRQREHARA